MRDCVSKTKDEYEERLKTATLSSNERYNDTVKFLQERINTIEANRKEEHQQMTQIAITHEEKKSKELEDARNKIDELNKALVKKTHQTQ